jgi:HAD superfamily hydrolase (TIGR01509 family)
MKKHIIFDCDGVIVDSEMISMEIDAGLLAAHGIVITQERMHHRFVGKTFAAMVAELALEHGVILPPDLEAQKDALMDQRYRQGLPEIVGLKDALLALRAKAFQFSMASNGPKHRIELALGLLGLRDHFQDIVTFEDVTHPKPAPDMYVLAAQRAGYQATDCIVVEDSTTGLRAAIAAGAHVLGFTGTHADPMAHGTLLRDHGAHQVFHHMRDLPGLVAGIFAVHH